MKASIFTILALLAGAPFAHAAKPAIHKAQSVSIEQLKREAQELAESLENARDCEFKIADTRDGVTLTVRDSHNVSAYLDVSSESIILLVDEDVDGDGSSHTYKVQGQGALRLVHAADAFERAELTDRDGRVLSCELDF